MKKIFAIITIITAVASLPSLALSVEPGPRITDREIVERLTKLEEGQKALVREVNKRFDTVVEQIKQLREDMNAQIKQLREDMNLQVKQLREDMNLQSKQLREDMNLQFGRTESQFNRLTALFTALVATIIGFAIWDRRTMIRPFETKVKKLEDEIAGNRTKLTSLLDSLRALSKTDPNLAQVLKSFNLL